MIEKINKLIEPLVEDFSSHSIEIIGTGLDEICYNVLLIKDSDIIKIFEIGSDEKLEQVDITSNMLGLINNIRRKNLCVL